MYIRYRKISKKKLAERFVWYYAKPLGNVTISIDFNIFFIYYIAFSVASQNSIKFDKFDFFSLFYISMYMAVFISTQFYE